MVAVPVLSSSNTECGLGYVRLCLSISLLTLSGCAALPGLQTLASPKPASSYMTAQSFSAATAAWPSDDWWTAYNDPQLSALIDEALADSPQMSEAAARLADANAMQDAAHSSLLPSLDASGSVDEAKQSYNTGIPPEFVPHGWNDTGSVGLNFNWTIDFWGKNRAALAAATSDAEAARADAATARLTLSTAVASAYASLASLYAQRATTADAVTVRRQTVALIRQRFANGMENEGAVDLAQSELDTARDDLAQVDESIALNRNQIAALLGAGPDRGLQITPPPTPVLASFALPADLPADLLGRRPEIIAAKLRVEAARKRIKESKAAFYPNVNLAASIGLQSLGIAMLRDLTSSEGSYGPAISLPIFDGDRLRADYRGSEANYELAVANYDSAVTQALQDVADAATSERALALRLRLAEDAETSAGGAYRVAQNRYQDGDATYLDVLTAEDSLITARQSVAALQTRGFSVDVSLVRALGGGYHA
jgi:NodT family efflux transporter outer membrane factor (OMF) lipoprotein